jgi:outer membrane protein
MRIATLVVKLWRSKHGARMYISGFVISKQSDYRRRLLVRRCTLLLLSACALKLETVTAFAQLPSISASHTSDSCTRVVTINDAKQCIAASQSTPSIPVLDQNHIYTLAELIDIAQAANPEGRIAWAAAKISLEREGIDRALYLPVLTFAAQGGDARAIVPFPKPLAPRGYVTVEQPLAYAQLELDYSLLDFGRGPRLDGSKALELASTLNLSRTHQMVTYRTSLQFYRTQQAIGQFSAAQTIVQTAETLLSNSQAQFDNGMATLPDLQNAQAGAAEARFDLTSATGEVKKAKLALSEVIGVEPTPDVEIEQQQDTLSAVETSIQDLMDTAWKSRPDLLARAQEVRHAQDALQVAHSAYLPTLSLGATGGQTLTWPSADYGQLGYANVSTWSAEVKLQWQLFNGARSHDVASARAQQTSVVEQQRETKDAVTRQVWDAYVDYQTAADQQRSSRTFLSAAETSYDSSLDAYKYGVRSLVDVVQAERQLAQARLAVVRSQSQLMQSAVTLSYAAGSLPGNTGGRP